MADASNQNFMWSKEGRRGKRTLYEIRNILAFSLISLSPPTFRSFLSPFHIMTDTDSGTAHSTTALNTIANDYNP
eukprot:scaffold164706_cov39-Cyclotella_meneghiniana.AAC.3